MKRLFATLSAILCMFSALNATAFAAEAEAPKMKAYNLSAADEERGTGCGCIAVQEGWLCEHQLAKLSKTEAPKMIPYTLNAEDEERGTGCGCIAVQEGRMCEHQLAKLKSDPPDGPKFAEEEPQECGCPVAHPGVDCRHNPEYTEAIEASSDVLELESADDVELEYFEIPVVGQDAPMIMTVADEFGNIEIVELPMLGDTAKAEDESDNEVEVVIYDTPIETEGEDLVEIEVTLDEIPTAWSETVPSVAFTPVIDFKPVPLPIEEAFEIEVLDEDTTCVFPAIVKGEPAKTEIRPEPELPAPTVSYTPEVVWMTSPVPATSNGAESNDCGVWQAPVVSYNSELESWTCDTSWYLRDEPVLKKVVMDTYGHESVAVEISEDYFYARCVDKDGKTVVGVCNWQHSPEEEFALVRGETDTGEIFYLTVYASEGMKTPSDGTGPYLHWNIYDQAKALCERLSLNGFPCSFTTKEGETSVCNVLSMLVRSSDGTYAIRGLGEIGIPEPVEPSEPEPDKPTFFEPDDCADYEFMYGGMSGGFWLPEKHTGVTSFTSELESWTMDVVSFLEDQPALRYVAAEEFGRRFWENPEVNIELSDDAFVARMYGSSGKTVSIYNWCCSDPSWDPECFQVIPGETKDHEEFYVVVYTSCEATDEDATTPWYWDGTAESLEVCRRLNLDCLTASFEVRGKLISKILSAVIRNPDGGYSIVR